MTSWINLSGDPKTTVNPTRLRFWRGIGKANHTKSLKKVMLAVRIHEERKSVEMKRSMLVRDFEFSKEGMIDI